MLKILLVSILMLFGSVNSKVPHKLFLTVYYESMCPDSRTFIINQLLPTVEQLHDYLKVQLVPFGKASSINNGHGGFQCQHGSPECRGNMMQDCALNLMKDRSDIDKVKYVVCEMNNMFGTKGFMQCAKNSNIPLRPLQYCVSSYPGIELQLEAERLTNQVKPRFIPTITLNREFNPEFQKRALEDLMGTLCAILNYVPRCQ